VAKLYLSAPFDKLDSTCVRDPNLYRYFKTNGTECVSLVTYSEVSLDDRTVETKSEVKHEEQ